MSKPGVPLLKTGDMLGFFSPAGPVEHRKIQPALKIIEEWGLKYCFSSHAFDKHGYLSAPIDQRIEDFHTFLKDKNIAALWALRGGYGSAHLLDQIDYEMIAQFPHLFIGFSDITALLMAIVSQTGFPVLNGLAPAMHLSPQNPYLNLCRGVLFGERDGYSLADFPQGLLSIQGKNVVQGNLIGGTLSILASLCGTKYLPKLTTPTILFLEDVDEPFYRIDRYWQQLRLSGFLDSVKAVILGKFLYRNVELDIAPLIKPTFHSEVPIIENFPYGHVVSSVVLPVGVPAQLRTSPFLLTWKWPKSVSTVAER